PLLRSTLFCLDILQPDFSDKDGCKIDCNPGCDGSQRSDDQGAEKPFVEPGGEFPEYGRKGEIGEPDTVAHEVAQLDAEGRHQWWHGKMLDVERDDLVQAEPLGKVEDHAGVEKEDGKHSYEKTHCGGERQAFGSGVLFQQLPEDLPRMAQERQIETLFPFDQFLVRDREQPSHDEHCMGMGEAEVVKER